jgi:hypothetical protein
MEQHPIRLLATFDDEQASLTDRVDAAFQIATWRRSSAIVPIDLAALFKRLLEFWQSLGSPREGDMAFLRQRVRAGWACSMMSRDLPDGPKVYKYYPRLADVEGPSRKKKGEINRGRLTHRYSSIFEFHREYPIEGFGTQKDLISVIEEDGTRTPLFDWCRQHEVYSYCGRCGLDITYEVSMDCPFMKNRFRPKPRPVLTPTDTS